MSIETTDTTETPTAAAPPPGWVDREVIERVLRPREWLPPGRALTDAERVEVARAIVAAGGGPTMISKRLHVRSQTARALAEHVRAEVGDE